MNKFWAVWRDSGGACPNKRHAEKQDAINEAERLVRQTGERYYILEVIGEVVPTQAPVEWREYKEGCGCGHEPCKSGI